MPKIPNATSMTRLDPSGQAAVTRLNTADVGAPERILGAAMQDYEQRRTKYQVAEARANYLTTKTQLEGTLEQDNDYQTLNERFGKGVDEAASQAASGIGNPDARAMFMESIQPDVAAAKEKVKGVAWDKEVKVKTSEYKDQIAKLRESGLTGDVGEADQAMTDLTNAAVDMGYLPADKRSTLIRQHKRDLALGRLNMMAPEDRMAALKQPWAKNLPSDKRAALIRESEGEQRRGIAQHVIDGYLAKGLDVEEARAKVQQKYGSDPKLREEVERRLDYAYTKQRQDEIQQREDLQDQFYAPVRDGDMTVADIQDQHPDEWAALGARGQAQLYAAQSQFGTGTGTVAQATPFNLEADETMRALITAGKPLDAREYFVDHVAEMSPAQQKSWSKLTIEGVLTPQAELAFSIGTTVKNKLDRAGVQDKETRATLMDKISNWSIDFQTREGRKPTGQEVNDQLNFDMREVSTGWFSKSYMFELPPAEQASMILKRDITMGPVLEQYMQKRGLSLTPQQIERTLQRMRVDDKFMSDIQHFIRSK